MSLASFLLGEPLATEESEGQTVGPVAGVPILGLDALASAAYGPEALLTVLLPLGMGALDHLRELTLLIIAVLVILFISYRQTIVAYPSGGGAYTVASENLGTNAALFAAAALALDYILNCAVAISAGVGAMVSMLPALLPYTLPVCLTVLALLTLMNLRGVRATGFAFMLPTYLFIASLLGVIGWGIFRVYVLRSAEPLVAPPRIPAKFLEASPWLLMHAFASGCTAMTGVEAVSNGVPIFCKPAERNAQRTLAIIIAVLIALLVGEALLCRAYGVTATVPGRAGYRSVLSSLTAAIVGQGSLYYLTIACVVAVLSLSANTSFADFPRLCSILARDKFLPEPLVHRGRRLAFSHGVWILSALSGLLLVVFGGVTEGLIPLFAVGALFAFTMSQAGMVMHWKKGRARGSLVLNGIGALATGITLCVVLAAKFREGAWLTVVIVALMLLLFKSVRRHYDFLLHVTATDIQIDLTPPKAPIAVVPLRRWDALAVKALRFALGFAAEVKVVQVLTQDRVVDDLSQRWREWVEAQLAAQGQAPPELVVLRSQYRELFSPLIQYVKQLAELEAERQIAVIIPELVERRWYYYALHNHSASFLKTLLLWRGGPQIVIVNIPWYLSQWRPERAQLERKRSATSRFRRFWPKLGE
jgi:amino acid transporter